MLNERRAISFRARLTASDDSGTLTGKSRMLRDGGAREDDLSQIFHRDERDQPA